MGWVYVKVERDKSPSTADGLQDYSRLCDTTGAALLIREQLITGFYADFLHKEIV